MPDPQKALLLLGIVFLLLLLIFNLKPEWRKVPGDLYIRKGPIRFYIPFVSAILLSVLLTLTLNFFKK